MDTQSAGDLETVHVTELGPLVSIDIAPAAFFAGWLSLTLSVDWALQYSGGDAVGQALKDHGSVAGLRGVGTLVEGSGVMSEWPEAGQQMLVQRDEE